MPLSEHAPKAVFFIIGRRTGVTATPSKQAIGTGFLVMLPAIGDYEFVHVYAVTAAHVVRSEREHWIRFNTEQGVKDLDGLEWVFHPTEDVAVAEVQMPEGAIWHAFRVDDFLDGWLADHPEAGPALGERVYFMGLLATMTAMADSNIPMVRSGTVGRLYQENVPLRLPDGTVLKVRGHLIDCRSYSGFSGSPCLTQYEWWYRPDPPVGALNLHRVEEKTLLMGVVSAHFDDWVKARTTGDVLGSVEAPLNTGVGIVTPVEAIREVLEDEDLADARKNAVLEHKEAQQEQGNTFTADSVPRDPSVAQPGRADADAAGRVQNHPPE